MSATRFLLMVLAAAFLLVQPNLARAGDATAPMAIDVSLVTPEDFAAIVIHPRRIAESPLVAAQLKDETIAAAIKKFGIDPSEVEEIVVLLSIDEDPEPVSVVIARFTHDVDAKEVLTKLRAAVQPNISIPIHEISVAGKTCLDLGGAEAPLAYAPSKNTIVITLGAGLSAPKIKESARKKMQGVLSIREPQGPLLERLKKAEADSDYIIALAPKAFPNLDKILDRLAKQAPPMVVTYLDAAKTVQGGTVTFNMTGPLLLRAVLDTTDADSAGNLADLLDQALRMAGGALVIAKQSIPREMKATLDPLVKLADQFIDGGKATKSGSQVTLDFKRPAILNTAGPQIVNAIRQSVLDARAAARRTQQMNNLKQISLAMLNYDATHGNFPPAAIVKDGKPLLSWRVAILPYLDQKDLYDQFHLDEPWDSPHNLPLSKTLVSVYQSPDGPLDNKTRVMLFTGKGAAFDGEKKIRVAEIRDGMSHTILCVEAGADKAAPWAKPEDLPFDAEKPLAALGQISPKGFPAAFFDGSVHRLKVDNATLKALITPDGGEAIDPAKMNGGR